MDGGFAGGRRLDRHHETVGRHQGSVDAASRAVGSFRLVSPGVPASEIPGADTASQRSARPLRLAGPARRQRRRPARHLPIPPPADRRFMPATRCTAGGLVQHPTRRTDSAGWRNVRFSRTISPVGLRGTRTTAANRPSCREHRREDTRTVLPPLGPRPQRDRFQEQNAAVAGGGSRTFRHLPPVD